MRQRLRCINLRAHLLNLRRLFLQTGVDCFERRFQFLDLLVLFEELVEQHSVDCAVMDAFDLPFFVTDRQVWVHLGYILGDQAVLQTVAAIDLLFITEDDRLERKERFAGVVHRFNLLLITPRGTGVTQ